MSKTYKIIICIIAAFILIATLPNFCKADDSIGDIISRGDDFVNTGKDQSSPVGQDTIKSNSSFIYNTLLTIGIIVALIVGMMIGIKFISGSLEEKAQVKEALVPYIIGWVVIFGAFGIWKLAVTALSTLE